MRRLNTISKHHHRFRGTTSRHSHITLENTLQLTGESQHARRLSKPDAQTIRYSILSRYTSNHRPSLLLLCNLRRDRRNLSSRWKNQTRRKPNPTFAAQGVGTRSFRQKLNWVSYTFRIIALVCILGLPILLVRYLTRNRNATNVDRRSVGETRLGWTRNSPRK
ncbi:hypothetical protein Hdeb2414_s0018g00521231 [Helianthus debilis subsp. tardiflorus]